MIDVNTYGSGYDALPFYRPIFLARNIKSTFLKYIYLTAKDKANALSVVR